MRAEPDPQDMDHDPARDHELYRVFAKHEVPLNGTLRQMLSEHFSHRTERRGCGFTQATRHLAVLVNQPRSSCSETVTKLFPAWSRSHRGDDHARILQRTLRAIPSELEREESRILVALIANLVLPTEVDPATEELPAYAGEIKVGTCPLAEKYFLEITARFVRRAGRANVLVSKGGKPLLIEKLRLGDNHSCINVAEIVLNGVRLPPGCLFGVQYDDDAAIAIRQNRQLPGSVIPISRCGGFRFLRLTTLAVTPENRQRAFSAHFQSQVAAGLFGADRATIEQLGRVAEEQL